MKKGKSNIAIVAGGALDRVLLPRIQKASYIIGVDRGAHWLIKQGKVPDVAIGDFDSVTKREFSHIKKKAATIIRELPHPKDATDLELAVEHAIGLKPTEVTIYGAIGTRIDHVWAGIHLLTKLVSHNICGYLVDKFNEIQIVRRGVILKRYCEFPYVSIFPIGEKATVTLSGFRYTVSRQVFVRGSTLGVSNEIVASSARIIVHKGEALVIRSRD